MGNKGRNSNSLADTGHPIAILTNGTILELMTLDPSIICSRLFHTVSSQVLKLPKENTSKRWPSILINWTERPKNNTWELLFTFNWTEIQTLSDLMSTLSAFQRSISMDTSSLLHSRPLTSTTLRPSTLTQMVSTWRRESWTIDHSTTSLKSGITHLFQATIRIFHPTTTQLTQPFPSRMRVRSFSSPSPTIEPRVVPHFRTEELSLCSTEPVLAMTTREWLSHSRRLTSTATVLECQLPTISSTPTWTLSHPSKDSCRWRWMTHCNTSTLNRSRSMRLPSIADPHSPRTSRLLESAVRSRWSPCHSSKARSSSECRTWLTFSTKIARQLR